jgi:peptidoglycan hydrolase-like protein with peptidoglycan-binding domain
MRRVIYAVLTIAILAGAGGAAYIATQHGGGAPAAAAASTLPTATAAVERTDLTTTESDSGTLGYTGSHDVINQAHGTITATIAEGTVVSRGQELYEVDGKPVVLMYGNRPAWRGFAPGMSDGSDVRQLDDNLIALGYATTANLTPSNTYSDADVAAVKRWQKALGLDQTGSIDLGSIVFLPGPIRISENKAKVGDAAMPGSPVDTATDTTRAVTLSLDTSKEALVHAGEAVGVDLPSGSTVEGTVSAISSVARTAQNGSTTIDVTISLADQSKLGNLDEAPVHVTIVTQSAKDVLAVPINALTVLPGGGYAVDVVESGRRHRVPVSLGIFSDTMVEVTGNGLQQGQRVEVPSV